MQENINTQRSIKMGKMTILETDMLIDTLYVVQFLHFLNTILTLCIFLQTLKVHPHLSGRQCYQKRLRI